MTTGTTIQAAIREQARIVQQAREDTQKARMWLSEARRRWEEEHKDQIEEVKDLDGLQAIAESHLRELGLTYFSETGNKHPGYGVEIKINTRVAYRPEDALAWGYEHKMALVLNVKLFEQLAKNGAAPNIATISEEPQAQIVTDLAKALANDLPTIEEMSGSDPDLTGGLSTEEYLKEVRGG